MVCELLVGLHSLNRSKRDVALARIFGMFRGVAADALVFRIHRTRFAIAGQLRLHVAPPRSADCIAFPACVPVT